MEIRPYAEFFSEFPDDHIERDCEEIQLRGLNVAQALVDILRRAGIDAAFPARMSGVSWEFPAVLKSGLVWFEVIGSPTVFVLRSAFRPRGWFFSSYKPYANLLTVLADGMTADPRFRQIAWRWRWDLLGDSPGVDRPVGSGFPVPAKPRPAQQPAEAEA